MTFHSLLDGLRVQVSQRIAGGELTERGLARRAGISQPHLHNVLKGVRSLTPDVADRLMATLSLNLVDLTLAVGTNRTGTSAPEPTHKSHALTP